MNYEYSPLTSPRCTRVIKLQSASDPSKPLIFKLVEISLDNSRSRSYEALSYTWGGQPLDRPVSCDSKTLLITANAEAALRRLRRKRKARYLWVDAICINQSSVAERNVQVASMGDIYRGAKRVLIWLGEATPHAEAAFLIMADVWRLVKPLSPLRALRIRIATAKEAGPWEPPGYDGIQFKLLRKLTPDQRVQLVRGVIDIESRPYWERVWTLQEVGLCRHADSCLVFCGTPGPVSLWFLEAIVRVFKGLELSGKLPWHEEHLDRRIYTSDLQSVLYGMRFKKATDPRDYIYGLRGLFPVELSPIPISYERPTTDIYRDVAQRIIENPRDSHSLGLDNILVLSAQEYKTVADCPSWVPDWSSLTVLDIRLVLYTYYDGKGSACLGAPAMCSFRPPGILVLTGREVTTVGAHVSAKFPPALHPNDLVDIQDATELRSSRMDGELYPYPEVFQNKQAATRIVAEHNGREMLSILQQFIIHSESYPEQLPHTLEQTAHLLSGNYESYPPDSSGSYSPNHGNTRARELVKIRQWLTGVKEHGPDLYPDFVMGDGSAPKHCYWSMPQHKVAYGLDGQKLFWTADGRPGEGLDVEPGDVITVLAGCHSAVVLRKVCGGRYRLVGHCIVLGVTKGEEWPKDDTLLREFEIV
ncbi:HET-domain-containing protein [Parachaetomium inaequale]|uniref:HET-domain-containing protein n=1 Tax=Parachaetomium inaequale TaxID=2588326 RepID=A0AAN6P647_9PEZI|nr:HET-domain-containing protein [Parachaetomium inaequale]